MSLHSISVCYLLPDVSDVGNSFLSLQVAEGEAGTLSNDAVLVLEERN